MAELMCGMINIQPDSFLCALENTRRVLESDRPEVVIMGDSLFRIISQKSNNGLWGHLVSEDTDLTSEFSVYTMNNETATSAGGYDFTMREVTNKELNGRDLPFVNESTVRDNATTMKVNYIRLGGGPMDKIPIVHVDAVQMERNGHRSTSTEDKAFCNSDGFKWEYFTVGSTAPALSQINPYNLLSSVDSEELNYKQVAQRSPSVSYIHQYDGAVVSVPLRSLHTIGNPKDLFTRNRRLKLQNELNNVISGDCTAITVDNMIDLAQNKDWYTKTNNPASVLEFDTRNMAIPNRECADSRPLFVIRPRVTLFNTSAMNSIENEIAQIGSELLAHFGYSKHAQVIHENLAFIEEALHYHRGLESMLTIRAGLYESPVIDQLNNDTWAKTRLFWSWLSDPVCAVGIRRALLEKENGDHPLRSEERTVLQQLDNLIHSVVFLFNSVVGKRENSVLAYLPALYVQTPNSADRSVNRGYPMEFTPDEVDYCNLMYWVILPSMGANVYCRNTADTTIQRTPIAYNEGDRNLANELNLSNEEALTAPRLPNTCVFAKAKPLRFKDITHLYEPTAAPSRCSHVGFHPTSIVTYMWAIRIHKLLDVTNHLARVLLGMHYSTLLTHNVICEHYDTKYYSGLSYLLFRGLRFTGCGITLMQQRSAMYTLGTGIICKPTSHNTHQVHSVNQYCESVVIPETLESPGVHIPNLYMKDLQGGDVHIDTHGPFDMVVADCFNGFCPEAESASGYRRPYIFTTGRSERLNGAVTRDHRMRSEGYTCMPTLLHPFSSVLATKPRHATRFRHGEESNHKLFCETHHIAEYDKGVLDSIGDPFKDTVERASGDRRPTHIMHKELGVAFCGTYGVGYTSDKKLMCPSDATRETLVDRLAPRINGTGIFVCNPIGTTHRLINPIFNRIFESSRWSRVLEC